jgi:5-methylcytosine-specific restriction protein A
VKPSRLKQLAPRVAELRPTLTVSSSWRSGLTSTQRGYGSRWRKFRQIWLRGHPLCGDRATSTSKEHSQCLREGRAIPASDVDHIVPHRGDQTAFWDYYNLQSLCSKCHAIKSQKEGQCSR